MIMETQKILYLILLYLDVILRYVKNVNNTNFTLLLKNAKDYEVVSNGVFAIARHRMKLKLIHEATTLSLLMPTLRQDRAQRRFLMRILRLLHREAALPSIYRKGRC